MRKTKKKEYSSDEYYTLKEDVEILLKYIPKDKVIWLPFDKECSNYYKVFVDNGYKVILSHKDNGKDFFNYVPLENYDIIVSNIPFSLKREIIKHSIEVLNKPFIYLVPSNIFSLKIIRTYAKNLNFIFSLKRHKFLYNGELKTPAECVYVSYNWLKHNDTY